MPYFIQHRIKSINLKLEEIPEQDKKLYLEIQLMISKAQSFCLKEIIKLFILRKEKGSRAACEEHLSLARNYLKYIDEKFKLIYPIPLLFLIKPLISLFWFAAFILSIRSEQKGLNKFIKTKLAEFDNVNTRPPSLGASESSADENLKDNTGDDKENFQPVFDTGNEYFIMPGSINFDNNKHLTHYSYRIYNKGYKGIREIIDKLELNEKLIDLNKMKIDLTRLIDAMNIDQFELNMLGLTYILMIKNSPELLDIIKDHYELWLGTEGLDEEESKVKIEDMLYSIQDQQKNYIKLLDIIEKDIKLLELQRLYQNENQSRKKITAAKGNKRVSSKSSKKKNPNKIREKIIWFGSEVQLIDLFFLLSNYSLLPDYDDETILPHFEIKGIKTTAEIKNPSLKNDHFFWFGSDIEFALLIDELVNARLISNHNKYCLFGNHFQNSRGKEFKSLSQKSYNKKAFSNGNSKVKDIIKKITEIPAKDPIKKMQ